MSHLAVNSRRNRPVIDKCVNDVLTIVKLQSRLKGEKASFEFMKTLIYRIFIKIHFFLYIYMYIFFLYICIYICIQLDAVTTC